MPIIPLGDRIITKALQQQTETEKAGFAIAENSQKDKPQRYEVLGIGDGEKAQELSVGVGDIVILNKYAGSEVDDVVDGEKIKVKIVLVGDVQGVVND